MSVSDLTNLKERRKFGNGLFYGFYGFTDFTDRRKFGNGFYEFYGFYG
jgi:hypothetical protein